MNDLSQIHWSELDRIYTVVRRELSVRGEWRYGPARVHEVVKQILSYVDTYGGIRDKVFCDLGCGEFHPFGISIAIFMNGARSCVATDMLDYNESRAAEAISDLLLDMYASPSKWNFYNIPMHIFMDRLRLFDIASLRAGYIDEGLRAVPIRHVKSDVSALDLSDESIDVLCSRSVLEHYMDFPRACAQMNRVIKEGGVAFHSIDLVDHRSYESSDFHYWSFLAEDESWHDPICNRLRPTEIRSAFENASFDILQYGVTTEEPPYGFLDTVTGRFRSMSLEDIKATGVQCVLRKNSQKNLLNSQDTSQYDISIPNKVAFELKMRQEQGWSDNYGAMYIAARYCGIEDEPPPFNHIWQHGCFGPWLKSHQMRYYDSPAASKCKIFVSRQDEVLALRGKGLERVYAIGLPINYLPEVNVSRHAKSLLIMPQHTLQGMAAGSEDLRREYVNQVSVFKDSFDLVVACVSPHCIMNGYYVDDFASHGIEVIEGASADDVNACLRMKCLFSQFETMTTNMWGSNVAYALSEGVKVSIYGNRIVPEPAEVSKDEAYARVSVEETKSMLYQEYEESLTHLAKFVGTPDKAIADRDYGNWLIGADNKITPSEMRNLFGW